MRLRFLWLSARLFTIFWRIVEAAGLLDAEAGSDEAGALDAAGAVSDNAGVEDAAAAASLLLALTGATSEEEAGELSSAFIAALGALVASATGAEEESEAGAEDALEAGADELLATDEAALLTTEAVDEATEAAESVEEATSVELAEMMVAVAAAAEAESSASMVVLARLVEFWEPINSQPATGPGQTELMSPDEAVVARTQLWTWLKQPT